MRPILLPFLVLLLSASALGQTPKLNPETLSGLTFRGIGPALASGRIADIAVHPKHKPTWYVAVGSGGVWKTTNAGITWQPVFDAQSSYSIGCVAVDPNRPETVWVGTGENVSGRHVGYGDGIYKSLDGGATWVHMGLKNSEHIGKILIDPRDSDVVYVAAEGPLWSTGGERGVYKTSDGGRTWARVLFVDDDTGTTDLEFDPQNPDVVYAAAYQRRRHVWGFLAGGPGSGIHKSTDGGATWRRMSNGLPKGDMGKIGLAVSPMDPRIVYATIEADASEKGFYRSDSYGERWEKRNSYISGATGPHYYQEIYASPHFFDRIYQMDMLIQVTSDGGRTFAPLGEPYKHVDNHTMAFDPDDPEYLLVGSDGGLYVTYDHGKNWRYLDNLPVTQFYKLALDNDAPFYNIVGGTQDNDTQLGPSRTANIHGIRNQDWVITIAADGYACAIDPEDPNVVYSEMQYGGIMRYNKENGELIDIKPQPEPGEEPERWNWDAPILISPHAHTRLYFGSQRVWRSDDRGDTWRPISGDLSRGRNRYEMPFHGRVWSVDDLHDNSAMSWYGNTTSITESPLVEGLLYVGTDDGLIQVTEDGGVTWRRSDRFPGVPDASFVNEVTASVHDANTVFAVVDNHKMGDYAPYVIKSTDRGRTWTSIRGDLPDRHLVWSIVEDHVDPNLLFVGTEFGIFVTVDGGRKWIALKGGVPTIAFRDLEIQRRENDLVGASFGRGFFILDDYSPLRRLSEGTLNQEAVLFPVRDAPWYVPSVPLGLPEKADEGAAFYLAPNPPYGAVFTYHLRDSLKTRRVARRDREKALREAGKDIPFPGWEVLEREDREDAPQLLLVVTDADGHPVRRIAAPSTPGLHRVAWDMRYPPSTPTVVTLPPLQSPWERHPYGPRAVPGAYAVELVRIENGVETRLAGPQTFSLVPLERTDYDAAARDEVLAFQLRTAELQRQVWGSIEVVSGAARRIPFLRQAALDTRADMTDVLERIRALDLRIKDLTRELAGDPTRGRLSEPSVPSVAERVATVVYGHWDTTYGPTQTHRRNLTLAEQSLAEARSALKQVIDVDLPALEQDLERRGAPWTPGRAAPEGG